MNYSTFNRINLEDLIKPIFDSIKDEFSTEKTAAPFSPSKKPLTNITETIDGYELMMSLPGFTKADVDISVKENHLTIASKEGLGKPAGDLLRSEFDYSKFSRTFKLSSKADLNTIEAKMGNGLLTIIVKKKTSDVERNITID